MAFSKEFLARARFKICGALLLALLIWIGSSWAGFAWEESQLSKDEAPYLRMYVAGQALSQLPADWTWADEIRLAPKGQETKFPVIYTMRTLETDFPQVASHLRTATRRAFLYLPATAEVATLYLLSLLFWRKKHA